ncbi:MAG: hypothetical protein ACOC44_04775 [Promethearchaeia archaeon]
MKLLYFDADKGKFFTVIGALFLVILISVRITLGIIASFNPIFEIIMNSIRIVLFNRVLRPDALILLACILYGYLIFDGFIDGIPMSLLRILILFLIYFIATSMGRFQLIFKLNLVESVITLDLSIILIILLLTSIGISIVEIFLYRMKFMAQEEDEQQIKEMQGVPEEASYEKLSPPKIIKKRIKELTYSPLRLLKKKDKWVNRERDTIYLKENEYPILKKWTTVEGNYKESFFQFYIVSSVILISTGFIYGLIRYFLFDIPAEGNYYNYFVRGLFFPMYTILLTSILSFRHFIRSVTFTVIVITLNLMLWDMGLITTEGIFLISIFVDFLSLFFIDLVPIFNQMSSTQLLDLFVFIISIVIQVQFLLLVINLSIRYLKGKGSRMEIFTSNQFLYVRQEEKFNTWMIFFDLLSLAIWPYNPANWRSMLHKVRFKIQSMREGIELNYGRLSYTKTIKKIKKIPRTRWKFGLRIGILIFLGIFTINLFLFYIFIGIIIIETWRFIRNKDKIKIKVKYKPQKGEGSLFLLANEDELYFYDVPRDIAALIPSVQAYD